MMYGIDVEYVFMYDTNTYDMYNYDMKYNIEFFT